MKGGSVPSQPNYNQGAVCGYLTNSGGGGGGGGGGIVSQDQFDNAVTSNGFPTPGTDQYNGFINSLNTAQISTSLEAAMYLAQLLHESG